MQASGRETQQFRKSGSVGGKRNRNGDAASFDAKAALPLQTYLTRLYCRLLLSCCHSSPRPTGPPRLPRRRVAQKAGLRLGWTMVKRNRQETGDGAACVLLRRLARASRIPLRHAGSAAHTVLWQSVTQARNRSHPRRRGVSPRFSALSGPIRSHKAARRRFYGRRPVNGYPSTGGRGPAGLKGHLPQTAQATRLVAGRANQAAEIGKIRFC